MLTGGLRTSALCQSVLVGKEADLLGFGRGSILCPDLPIVLHERPISSEDGFGAEPVRDHTGLRNAIVKRLPRISLVGAGTSMAWYVVMLRVLSQRRAWRPPYGIGAIIYMWIWVDAPELDVAKTPLPYLSGLFIVLGILALFFLAASD